MVTSRRIIYQHKFKLVTNKDHIAPLVTIAHTHRGKIIKFYYEKTPSMFTISKTIRFI